MKLNKKSIALICELEKIIGDECYNPNSYDGWADRQGCAFRYPVTFDDENGNERKSWFQIQDLSKDNLNSVHYKFGSNHLYIGSAIYNILQRLEQKYGISFDELMKGKK